MIHTRNKLSARVIKNAGPQKLYPNKEGLDPLQTPPWQRTPLCEHPHPLYYLRGLPILIH